MNLQKIIFFGIVMVLFNACGEDSAESSGDNISLSKGLVAHYKFEDNALDSSGNGNHGEEHGGVTYVDGVIGKASKFNGSMDEYITAPNSESLSVQNQLSISVWAKIDTFVFGTDPIVTKGHRSEDYTLWVTAKGESLLLNWNTYQQFWEVDDENIETNKWVYLTTTYDGNSVKYFINGVKTFEKDFNLAIQKNNEPLYIGSSYPGGEEYFKGLIDDLRIYNRALTESEIKELSQMGL